MLQNHFCWLALFKLLLLIREEIDVKDSIKSPKGKYFFNAVITIDILSVGEYDG